MNTSDCYCIKVTAELQSVSKAAKMLSVSQPALSAHIKKIEEELGIIIFDRTKKPLTLTEEGRVYLEYALKRIALEKELERYLSDLNGLNTGSLVIGGAGAFNSVYIPKAVRIFSEKYPGVDIKIIDGNVPEIERRTLDGEIDLFITPPRTEHRDISVIELFDDRILLCVPACWPVNEDLRDFSIPAADIMNGRTENYREADFSLFRGSTFVLLGQTQHLRYVAEELFEKYSFRPSRIICAEQTLTSFALTLEGVGASFMTDTAVRNGNFRYHPVYYMADREICRRKISVAYDSRRGLSCAGKEFISILRNSLTALQ